MSSFHSLPTPYQHFIFISRYARWLEKEGRRETWEETIDRYFKFFEQHLAENNHYNLTPALRHELKTAILNLEIMPSMRSLMTAGEALKRDNTAGYNCSYVAVNRVRAFDEILYTLMCLSPDTELVTINGNKKISEIDIDKDILLTRNEQTGEYEYEQPISVLETRTGSDEEIIEFTFEDGSTIQCTADHKFLTKNRGWVEANDLNESDVLETPDLLHNTSPVPYKSGESEDGNIPYREYT